MEEKKQVLLDLKMPRKVTFEFPKDSGLEIELRPFLTYQDQCILINSYARAYFGSTVRSIEFSPYDYVAAESKLGLDLAVVLTNIKTLSDEVDEDGNKSLLLDADAFYLSGLADEIKSRIKNYSQFRENLDRTITDIKENLAMQKQVGTVLDNFVESVPAILSNLLGELKKLIETDISPESIKEIQKLTRGLSKELNSPAISGLIKESSQQEQKNNAVAEKRTTRTRKPRTTK